MMNRPRYNSEPTYSEIFGDPMFQRYVASHGLTLEDASRHWHDAARRLEPKAKLTA